VSTRVGMVLLAAGASRRMEGDIPKQLLTYKGQSFLRHVTGILCASVCSPIVVVLGANAERLLPELSDLPVHPIANEHWEEGMGASVRAGVLALQELDANLDALIVTLCDQPLLTSEHLNALVAVHAQGAKIVASEYGESFGPPVLFDCSLFDELATLSGDEGARRVIRRHESDVVKIPFPAGAFDIDTAEDYETITER